MAMLGGTSPVQAGAPQADDGAMWFRPATAARTTVGGVGLDMVLWERMRWEVRGGEGRPVGCGHRQWRRVSDLLFKLSQSPEKAAFHGSTKPSMYVSR